MKERLSLIFMVSFLCLLSSCKKERIILNPDYDSNNVYRMTFGIDKIELTDSLTIFHITFYNEPGFYYSFSKDQKLIGCQTGKVYPLKWMEGISPDVKVHVDSTGYFSAKLVFGALDPIEKEVDFIEEEQYYSGIKLYDTTKGKLRTHLSGHLYPSGGSWLFAREIGSKNKVYIIPVKNGKFNFDIFTDSPLLFKVFIGNELTGEVSKISSFWSEGGDIKLIYPDDPYEEISVTGGPLTSEFLDLKKRSRASYEIIRNSEEWKEYKRLENSRLLYKPEYYSLRDSLKYETIGWKRLKYRREIYKLISDGVQYTDEGLEAIIKYQEFEDARKDTLESLLDSFYMQEFKHPSLSALAEIYLNVISPNQVDKNLIWFDTYFKDSFTDHPYHQYLSEINSLLAPEVGNYFAMFTAKDQNENEVKIHDLAEGKTSLIIFLNDTEKTAPSFIKDLYPLYDKYKEEGFEIIEVKILNTDHKEENKKRIL